MEPPRATRSTEREGVERIGYGMATAAYPTNHFPATARLTMHADGSVLAETATHEIGQGAITSLSQVVADALAMPLSRVQIAIGDTTLPFGAFSAGSSTSLSVGSALMEAARELSERLARLARVDRRSPLYGCSLRDIVFREGTLQHRIEAARTDPATAVLARAGLHTLEVKGISGRLFGKSRYARMSFGAQFARVAVNKFTGGVRVTHMTGAFAGGRILNARTARSQLLGGMVWGVGHALMEESLRDLRTGAWVNANLAEAHVPTNADAPEIDILMIPEDDSRGSELGAKGPRRDRHHRRGSSDRKRHRKRHRQAHAQPAHHSRPGAGAGLGSRSHTATAHRNLGFPAVQNLRTHAQNVGAPHLDLEMWVPASPPTRPCLRSETWGTRPRPFKTTLKREETIPANLLRRQIHLRNRGRRRQSTLAAPDLLFGNGMLNL